MGKTAAVEAFDQGSCELLRALKRMDLDELMAAGAPSTQVRAAAKRLLDLMREDGTAKPETGIPGRATHAPAQ